MKPLLYAQSFLGCRGGSGIIVNEPHQSEIRYINSCNSALSLYPSLANASLPTVM